MAMYAVRCALAAVLWKNGLFGVRMYSKKDCGLSEMPTTPKCPSRKKGEGNGNGDGECEGEGAKLPKFVFSAENMVRAEQVLSLFPQEHKRGALIPLLDLAQRQHGWLPIGALYAVGDMLQLEPFQVWEVATFYHMFKMKPQGKYKVHVCVTTSCCLRGADKIFEVCKKELKLSHDETSKDMKFTLAETECLGACVNAPVVAINDDFYEDLTPDDMKDILDDLKKDEIPPPGPRSGRYASEPVTGLTSLKMTPPPPGFKMQNLDE